MRKTKELNVMLPGNFSTKLVEKSSISLLKKGGNQNLKSIIMDRCDHSLTKKDRKTGRNVCKEDVLGQIIEWINNL